MWTKASFIWVSNYNIFCWLFYYIECDSGTFGRECRNICGKCKGNNQCHHINGTCMEGCHPGFIGLQCDQGTSLCLKRESISYFLDAKQLQTHISFFLHIQALLYSWINMFSLLNKPKACFDKETTWLRSFTIYITILIS